AEKEAKAKQAEQVGERVAAEKRAHDVIAWWQDPDTNQMLGWIEDVPGIEFTVKDGELHARAMEKPRTVLLNGKEKVELTDQFTMVASEEKDTITVDGKTFQISGHESRLIRI